MKNYKIAVVTSICGLNAELKDPDVVFDGVDYISFVDREHRSNVWIQKHALDFSLDENYRGRRNAKIYKVMPQMFLPDYEYWFWVDSTHELIMNPYDVIENYLKDSEIGLWKHTSRDCLYDEGNIVNSLGYDHNHLVTNQINYYQSVNYPVNNGLFELPALVRKNTDNIKVLNLRWWEQICKFSSRDQISFPYVLWKTNIKPTILPGWANGGLHQNPIIPQVRFKSV